MVPKEDTQGHGVNMLGAKIDAHMLLDGQSEWPAVHRRVRGRLQGVLDGLAAVGWPSERPCVVVTVIGVKPPAGLTVVPEGCGHHGHSAN